MIGLLKKLKACRHESCQLFLDNQRYQICWSCGSHRKIGHTEWSEEKKDLIWMPFGPWTKPHLWRNS